MDIQTAIARFSSPDLAPAVVVANDAQDNLNACDGLPAKESNEDGVEDDVGVAGPVLAFLHLG